MAIIWAGNPRNSPVEKSAFGYGTCNASGVSFPLRVEWCAPLTAGSSTHGPRGSVAARISLDSGLTAMLLIRIVAMALMLLRTKPMVQSTVKMLWRLSRASWVEIWRGSLWRLAALGCNSRSRVFRRIVEASRQALVRFSHNIHLHSIHLRRMRRSSGFRAVWTHTSLKCVRERKETLPGQAR
jgi:hypothetical protein